eukprot:gene14559-biopygen8298
MLFRPETSCPKEWRSWGCVESPGRRGKRRPPAEDCGAPQKMLRAVEDTNAEGGEDPEDVDPGGTAWKVVEGCGGRWNTGEDARDADGREWDGRPWRGVEGCRGPWKTVEDAEGAEGRGRPRKAAEGRGRPRKAAEGRGRPRKARKTRKMRKMRKETVDGGG